MESIALTTLNERYRDVSSTSKIGCLAHYYVADRDFEIVSRTEEVAPKGPPR